jgi:hypothetical protein
MPRDPNTSSIPPESFMPVTRQSAKPQFLQRLGSDEAFISPETIPDTDDIDTTFDRDALITSRPIPEVVPILLGLRARLTERRITRAQTKVEKLAEQEPVIRFVGKSLIQGKGYQRPDESLRPSTFGERRAAKKLDKIMSNKRRRQRFANNISDRYLVVKHGSQGDIPREPDFEQAGTSLSWLEERNNRKNARTSRRLNRQINRRDRRFAARIVTKPHRKAERLIKRRNKLVIKHAAIEKARTP